MPTSTGMHQDSTTTYNTNGAVRHIQQTIDQCAHDCHHTLAYMACPHTSFYKTSFDYFVLVVNYAKKIN